MIQIPGIAIAKKSDEPEIYELTGEEMRNIANKMATKDKAIANKDKEIANLEQQIKELEGIVSTLKKEKELQGEIIIELRAKNTTLEQEMQIRQELNDEIIASANKTISLLEGDVANLESTINDYKKKSTLNITQKLQFLLMGVALETLFN